MKHIVIRNAVSAVILCAVLGCSQQSLRREMKEFMSNEIALPVELTEIKDGHMRSVKMTMDKPMLIVFYGVDECSSCAINHLNDDLSGFVDIEQSGKCKVVILFSPSEDDQLDVQDQIRELKFPFPVYVDLYGDFYRINKDFPSDRRFHSFLLGNDAHPVFVGNPLHGKKQYKVFEKVLKNKQNINSGGPFNYIKIGLNYPLLASLYAIILIISYIPII